MVLQGDVVKMKTVGNKEIVRVFINKDSLVAKSGFYKQMLNLEGLTIKIMKQRWLVKARAAAVVFQHCR